MFDCHSHLPVSPTIMYEPRPQPDEIALVQAGLSAYNRQYAPDDTLSGYTVYGVLENFPPGERKYLLQKSLA